MGTGGATSRQISLFEDYEGFVEKFKPKKTTDDCYTPPEVYEAVRGWVFKEYGLDTQTPVMRPFRPGGDYEHEEYPEGCLVLDNPPFSMLSRIVRFYLDSGTRFFLFAPTLTCFNSQPDKNHVIAGAYVVYENGAKVDTSFVTSLGEDYVRSAPELKAAIEDAQKRVKKKEKPTLPKYVYPPEVLTAAQVGRYSKYGVDFRVKRRDCTRVRALDAQRAAGKTVFGSGMLLSERAAAERAAAIEWELSPRERAIVRMLGNNDTERQLES